MATDEVVDDLVYVEGALKPLLALGVGIGATPKGAVAPA